MSDTLYPYAASYYGEALTEIRDRLADKLKGPGLNPEELAAYNVAYDALEGVWDDEQ